MYEIFVEVTDQLFWEGYTQQLANEKPEQFQAELTDFLNTYNNENHGTQS